MGSNVGVEINLVPMVLFPSATAWANVQEMLIKVVEVSMLIKYTVLAWQVCWYFDRNFVLIKFIWKFIIEIVVADINVESIS